MGMNDRGFINTLYQQFKNQTLFREFYAIEDDHSSVNVCLVKFPTAFTWTQSATTVTITCTGHGFRTGQSVQFFGMVDNDGDGAATMAELQAPNTYWAITRVNDNSFTVTTTASATVTGTNTGYLVKGVPPKYWRGLAGLDTLPYSTMSIVLLGLEVSFGAAGGVKPEFYDSTTAYRAGPAVRGVANESRFVPRFIVLPALTGLYITPTSSAVRAEIEVLYSFDVFMGGASLLPNVSQSRAAVADYDSGFWAGGFWE